MKILIFDHTDTDLKDWKVAMDTVNKYLAEKLEYSVIHQASRTPVFNDYKTDGGWGINAQWFRDTYAIRSMGYDFCLAYFTTFQWLRPHPTNKHAGHCITESYGVSEIAMYGKMTGKNKRSISPNVHECDFVYRLLHELCHAVFKHKQHTQDVTHYWDYEKGNLLEALKLWNMNKRELLYETAVSYLGKDASPADKVSDSYGCAESVTTLLKQVDLSIPILTGTWSLWDLLRTPKFKEVQTPERGDIILCVTGTGNGKVSNGHTGIFLDSMNIASNDSKTGQFIKNYTLKSWRDFYGVKGGYPVYIYRIV